MHLGSANNLPLGHVSGGSQNSMAVARRSFSTSSGQRRQKMTKLSVATSIKSIMVNNAVNVTYTKGHVVSVAAAAA